MKERVKAFFRRNPNASFKPKSIAEKLYLDEYEFHQLKSILHKLVEEAFLEKVGKKYRLLKQVAQEITGIYRFVPEGNYGFVTTEHPGIRGIFISEKNSGTAIDGDLVRVELLAYSKRTKRYEGEITEVLERGRTEITGTLRKKKAFYFVEPDDPKINVVIHINKKALNGAKPNDKVIVTNIEWEHPQILPFGVIQTVLGKSGTYDVEIASLAIENGFSPVFPKNVISATKKIPIKIDKDEISKRVNYRNVVTFTIDPKDAKDFDDALSVRKLKNGNYEVGIHIADVSHYVKKGEPIYEEAKKRATSVYFVGRVVPMLPEKLSNKVCSLVPNEDRLTFSVIAELTPRAKVIKYQIAKTVINSNKRFTYEEAQKILDEKKGKYYDELFRLYSLSSHLRNNRYRKGSINFHTPEVEFELNDDGYPINIRVKKDLETHHLVEEFMLLANRLIATYVNKDKKKENPFVYRIHDFPEREKLIEFGKFVKSLGYNFDPNSPNTAKQFQQILEQVKGTEEEALINSVAIRSMAKAEYSTQNIGHYGLAFKYYTHFTSPIRRFPDLVVHDLIFSYANKKKINYTLRELDDICKHSSEQERNATNAERESVKIKQVEFMQKHIGDVFPAVISGVTNFGMFVELTENLAEGLIKLRDMENDYYEFNERQYSLVGTRTGKVFRLGDKVNVQVIRVDTERKEIDFVLYDEEPEKDKNKTRKVKRTKGKKVKKEKPKRKKRERK